MVKNKGENIGDETEYRELWHELHINNGFMWKSNSYWYSYSIAAFKQIIKKVPIWIIMINLLKITAYHKS